MAEHVTKVLCTGVGKTSRSELEGREGLISKVRKILI